jgi:Dyp-type peroxidase family
VPENSELEPRESETIQGNVLAAFNKDNQVFIFLQFSDPQYGAAWLGDLVPRLATTKAVAFFNDAFSQARRSSGGDPSNLKALWLGVGLTKEGLFKLAPQLEADASALDPSFVAGPVERARALGDRRASDPSEWVFGGPGQPCIDAILTIAADDLADLRTEVNRQWSLAARHRMFVVYEQLAQTLPGQGASREHFGFRDGISQPGVIGFDPPDELGTQVLGRPGTWLLSPGEFVLGQHREFETNPPVVPNWLVDGSYQVFRRLAQDVPSWWAQVIRQQYTLRSKRGESMINADLLGAKMIGRWRSGTPLANAPEGDNRSAQDPTEDNSFEFGLDDPAGLTTPRFAHIRKMYSRDVADDQAEKHRILRRGIPYGLPFDPTLGRGYGVDAERGLCFNAFMASIKGQFEYLQEKLANTANLPRPGDGKDPVIGEGSSELSLIVGMDKDGKPAEQSLDFQRFVTTTGAAYAIVLSIPTLQGIASGDIKPGKEYAN